MPLSPSQRWSSAVQDLFSCARGRLPASFLERKLADLGLSGIAPLPNSELARFEKAIDLVNALVDGRPAPGGLRPDAAMEAAFPADHPTLGALKALAQEYIAAMRPSKKAKAAPAPSAEPVAAPQGERRDRGPRPDRGDRFDRGPRPDRFDRGPRPERAERPAPPPRLPRISWEAFLARHLKEAQPKDAAAAVAPAPAPAEAPAADGAAVAPAPVAAPVPAPAPEVFVPHALAAWQLDGDAKRQLARIRERVIQAVAAQAAAGDVAAAVREIAFAVLRPPLAVRDDLRHLIHEHLAANGVQVAMSALYPPPALAAMRRDWEGLLAARGPADPAVEAAWSRMLEAHPEAKAKLEQERARERDGLFAAFAEAVREHGAEAPEAAAARSALAARFAGLDERIAAVLAEAAAAREAIAAAGRLVAERHWGDAEVLAALAALAPPARARLEAQRRHEFDELDRRFRAELKAHGPDGAETRAALERLSARFPAEGATAAERLNRIRRGDELARQEQERRAGGRSPSTVHLGGADHRLPRIRPASRLRLVVAAVGGRGRGHAVGLVIAGELAHGPVAADWRAPASASLDELDAAVQAVADRELGVLGLPLAACPEAGSPWADAAAGLAAAAVLALPAGAGCELAVELPAWAELPDPAALDAALAALSRRGINAVRAACSDHAAALAEAVAWSWGGKREAEVARIRQSGLLDGALLEPSAGLRDALAALAKGELPGWGAWSQLVAEASADAGGLAAALLARCAERLAGDPEACQALQRHLGGQAKGRIADPTRLLAELAWCETHAVAGLRPRDALRLAGALVAARAAAAAPAAEAVERFAARCSELREDQPAEVLEAALHAAAHLREALDPEQAEAALAPWQRADAFACGGRGMLVRLAEERARIAAALGRWKDARRHLERCDEVSARISDAADRATVQARVAQLRASVLADDPAAPADEARAAIIAATGESEPIHAAGALAVDGAGNRRHLHHALLRWAVRRREDAVCGSYLGRREQWCEVKELPGGHIDALRAVLLAPTDPTAARALLAAAAERLGGHAAPAATRLSLAACDVACALLGAKDEALRERLAGLRRSCPAAGPAVTALERALTVATDAEAGLAEALPLLAR